MRTLALTLLLGCTQPQDSGQPTPTRIWMLGDSLTEGYFLPDLGGYRTTLYQRLSEKGLQFDFVGSASSGPAELPDHDNEGHQGQEIQWFTPRVQDWYESTPFDVAVVMVGSAHVAIHEHVQEAPAHLTELLREIDRASDVEIFVAQIPPFGMTYAGYEPDVEAFNEAVVTVASELDMRVVDQFTGFDAETMTNDGVHPTAAGYELIGNRFADALETR